MMLCSSFDSLITAMDHLVGSMLFKSIINIPIVCFFHALMVIDKLKVTNSIKY